MACRPSSLSINQLLPPGIHVDVIKEQATFIKNSVEALEEHLVLGQPAGIVDRVAVHPRLAHAF